VEVPGLTPVTTPVDASTVALAVLLLLHVPPLAAMDSDLVAPGHTFIVPVMPGRVELTVITVLL
jgi:hypothetical protein